MTLAPGTRIGPYEVVSMIGAGGMGEVYRARDTRLQRDVALKVLPPLFADDPERLARFEREAQMLAALNHPNIAAIHGLEDSGSTRALILELVEGETLADIIARRAMPLSEAVPIALQVADALEAAHEHGIVHRDLKPANIKITPEGRVKVLDFGLAKALTPEPGTAAAAHLSQSPTITSPAAMTGAGMLLGTAPYMSPEQARGKMADKRVDIWGFGCVLFEMLSGRRAFTGDTAPDTIAHILGRDPDWAVLPPGVPERVRALLRRCLQKDPVRRLRDIHDAMFELEDAVAPDQIDIASAHTALERRRVGVTAAVVVVASVAIWWFWPMRQLLGLQPSERSPVRSTIPGPPESHLISVGPGAGPAVISPDGRRLTFVAAGADGTRRLWIRPLGAVLMRPLVGTEGASYPFWSPDGEQVGFFADGKLKKVSVSGGNVTTLCDARNAAGGSWSPEGTIVFAPYGSGLQQISASGGSPRTATILDRERRDSTHRWPAFLPDGRRFLFAVQQAKAGIWTIRLGSLDSDRVDDVLEANSNAVYANGSLLFARGGTLLAQPVNERSMRAVGNAVPLAENVLRDSVLGKAVFSASQTGRLVFQGGFDVVESRLVWLSRNGQEAGVLQDMCACSWPRISHDGRRAAVSITDPTTGNADIWVYEIGGGRRLHLTFDAAYEMNPTWAADDGAVFFTSTRTGVRNIHRIDSRNRGPEEVLSESEDEKWVQSTSVDGRWLVFYKVPKKRNSLESGDLWLLPLTAGRRSEPEPFLTTEHTEQFGEISPDGHWFVYQSNESGKNEVWVTSFPTRDGKWLISEEGGILPRWSANGKEIFYLNQEHSSLFAAAVTTQGAAVQVLSVQRLFSAPMVAGRGFPYDVTKDGQRFLAITADGATSTPLTLVTDWPAELNR